MLDHLLVNMAQLLLFSIDDVHGAIPLDDTLRVIRMVSFEKETVGGPAWDAGTINLHGKSLSVVSVRSLLGFRKTEPRLTDMLIITRAGSRDVALWVDATAGAQEITLPQDAKEFPCQTTPEGNGVLVTPEGTLVIYDLPGLIAAGGIPAGISPGDSAPARDTARPDTDGQLPGDAAADTAHINAVLAERAAKIARPEESMADTRTAEVLRFRLAYRECAIDMEHIREVILTGEITPVPGTPDFISGICIVRGEIISLVDLRVLLAIPETGLTDLNRVIVLTDGTLTFGILADHITGIGILELDRIISGDTESPVAGSRYVKGVADGALIVLDTQALFADPRMIIDEA
jgi:chemotaxis signal transduction protein